MEKLKKILVEKILSKSQIKDLEISYVENLVENYFLKEGKIRKKLEIDFESKKEKIVLSKNFKEVVKNIRKEIGIVYGSFLTGDFDKKEDKLDKCHNADDLIELLKLHKSTRERINFYEEIYNKIFSHFKTQGVLDIACGLNPLSYFIARKFNENDFKYFATDLNPMDMDFLNKFFEKFDIEGIAMNYNITNLEILSNHELAQYDLVFLFKALDSFESVKRNISKELLEKLPQKNIVVSFPTKSLVSKKEVKSEKRNWFVNYLNNKEWKYDTFEVENEYFFLIRKN